MTRDSFEDSDGQSRAFLGNAWIYRKTKTVFSRYSRIRQKGVWLISPWILLFLILKWHILKIFDYEKDDTFWWNHICRYPVLTSIEHPYLFVWEAVVSPKDWLCPPSWHDIFNVSHPKWWLKSQEIIPNMTLSQIDEVLWSTPTGSMFIQYGENSDVGKT